MFMEDKVFVLGVSTMFSTETSFSLINHATQYNSCQFGAPLRPIYLCTMSRKYSGNIPDMWICGGWGGWRIGMPCLDNLLLSNPKYWLCFQALWSRNKVAKSEQTFKCSQVIWKGKMGCHVNSPNLKQKSVARPHFVQSHQVNLQRLIWRSAHFKTTPNKACYYSRCPTPYVHSTYSAIVPQWGESNVEDRQGCLCQSRKQNQLHWRKRNNNKKKNKLWLFWQNSLMKM